MPSLVVAARRRRRRTRFEPRWTLEAPLWCAASALWATDAGLGAVDAAAPGSEMDRWSEEAGCGAVPALFELLDVRGDEGDEEEASEKDEILSEEMSPRRDEKTAEASSRGFGGAAHAGGARARCSARAGMLKAAVGASTRTSRTWPRSRRPRRTRRRRTRRRARRRSSGGGGGRRRRRRRKRRRVGVPRRRGKSGDSRRPRRRARAREERRRPKQQHPGKSLVERARERAHSREGGSVGSSRTSAAVLRRGFPPEGRLFPPRRTPRVPTVSCFSVSREEEEGFFSRSRVPGPSGGRSALLGAALAARALARARVRRSRAGGGALAARARPARSSTPSRGRFPSSLRPRRRLRGSGATF